MHDYKMTKTELRVTCGLSAIFSIRILGVFMILPVLTIYGMDLHGANKTLIGLAVGIYGLMQAAFQIPFGLMSDRFSRKWLIIIGLLMLATGSSIAALTNNIWGLIIGRTVQGSGAITAVIMALLSDFISEQNQVKAMAYIGISFGLTFAIAIIIGPIITYNIGLSGLFWVIAILALFGIAIVLFIIPIAKHHIFNRESSIICSNFINVLTNKQLLKLNVGIFFLHTMLMSIFITLPIVMTNAGLLYIDHWKVYLVAMLVSFITLIPIIIYAEVKRCIKRMFLSCINLLLVAELVFLAAYNHIYIICMGIQIFFLAFNIMETLLPSLVSKESPAGCKGTAMGIYSTSQFLGVACGGMLSGFLLQFADYRVVFLVGVIIAIIWLLISITLREPNYLSSLRITLPKNLALDDHQLIQVLKNEPGVTEAIIVPEELNAYIKFDTKQTNRTMLEKKIEQLQFKK